MPGRNGKRATPGGPASPQLERQPHGGALKRTRKPPAVAPDETPGETPPAPLTAPVRTPSHGVGQLRVGNPGNAGGLGAPTSIVRERLRGSYEERLGFLGDVVDGKVMQRSEVPLVFLLPHVKCPLCGVQGMKLKDADDAFLPIEARVSASVKDRLSALDQMAKYGIGTIKEVSVENVRERWRLTMAIIRENTPPELGDQLAKLIRPIWK